MKLKITLLIDSEQDFEANGRLEKLAVGAVRAMVAARVWNRKANLCNVEEPCSESATGTRLVGFAEVLRSNNLST